MAKAEQTVVVTLRLPVYEAEWIDVRAARTDLSRAAWIRDQLVRAIAKAEGRQDQDHSVSGSGGSRASAGRSLPAPDRSKEDVQPRPKKPDPRNQLPSGGTPARPDPARLFVGRSVDLRAQKLSAPRASNARPARARAGPTPPAEIPAHDVRATAIPDRIPSPHKAARRSRPSRAKPPA